jgi:hypothetical protein
VGERGAKVERRHGVGGECAAEFLDDSVAGEGAVVRKRSRSEGVAEPTRFVSLVDLGAVGARERKLESDWSGRDSAVVLQGRGRERVVGRGKDLARVVELAREHDGGELTRDAACLRVELVETGGGGKYERDRH